MGDTKRQVFFSFHYSNDCRRAAQVRNIGVIEGNAPLVDNDWEKLKNTGKTAVENWIKKELRTRSCLVVLIGEETADRPWIKYEIQEAWNSGKGVVGIYIHNIKDPVTGKCTKGMNPFKRFLINGEDFSEIIDCYDPDSNDAYNDIADKISDLVEDAIETRQAFDDDMKIKLR